MRNFETWLGQMRRSIATYDYYVNFATVVKHAEKYKAELYLMNSLIGSKNVEGEFKRLFARYPEIKHCIPALLAVREREIFARDKDCVSGIWYDFDKSDNTVKEYCDFMRKTGLFNLISKHLVNNLYDYVVGVETGLDSHARKNRGGDLMEDAVEGYLKRAGLEYFKEMKTSEIQERWGLDLSSLTNNGKSIKKFDFVVHTPKFVYGIETNFYRANKDGKGGGSKLNETARSYHMLATQAKSLRKFKFVWITDGAAWNSAKENLRATFQELPTLYNLKDLEDGIALAVFR